MQHHSHQTRQPHMRAHHVQHQQTAPPPHLALNLSLPQQQQNVAAHQPQQQPPTPHHMNNVGPPLGTVNTQQQQPKSSYMQPHNRMSHHQQQHHLMQAQQQQLQQRINPQTIHTTNQMQKIRQQHQLVNNSNNNNININQHQQHQQQHQQHQRNIHHNAHHVPHMKPQQQQQHITNAHQPISILKHPQQHEPLPQQQQQKPHAANVSILKQPQPPQQLQSNKTSNVGLPQQQQQCFQPVDNKPIHNNNPGFAPAVAACSVAAPSVPKSILQNPNRSNNNKQTNSVVTPAKESATANIAHTEGAATPVVSAKQNILATAVSSEDSSSTEAVSDKENVPTTTTANDCEGELSSDNAISLILDPNSGSNSKEKTPMCLVNELARFNKITHQYRLTNEKGPAHCKRFTVTLKLGDEEYSAEGYKIKKAQHLAAAEAIEKTKYKHPVPKLVRRTEEGGTSRATITPTVELNALAMKLGQQTYYLFDPRSQPSPDNIMPTPSGPDMMYRPPPHGPPLPHVGGPLMPPPPHHMIDAGNPYMRRHAAQYQQRFNNYRGGYSHPNKYMQRYPLIPPALGHNGMPPLHHQHSAYPPPPATICKITLIVGKQKFIGSGRTLQAAKHDAASRALQVLKTQAASKLNEILNRSLEESDSKSPISLVHEIGIKRSLTVHFKVLREEGPAHMKNFITACIAGNIITEGDGNGKKISKKRAAEKMLEELKKLPPLTPTKSPVKRLKVKPAGGAATAGTERKKRAGGASIKEKSEADIADSENPISKLIVLLQSRKEAEPIYELISKNGNETTRRREFIMEVTAAGKAARGTGNNMKTAKRNAAQTLLDILCGGSNLDATAAPSLSATSACSNEIDKPIQSIAPEKTAAPLQMDTKANNVAKTVLALQPPPPVAEKAPIVDLPLVTTTAGQVPGILILRQNKKNSSVKNAVKNVVAPAAATAATIPKVAAPVEAHVMPAPKVSATPALTTAPACDNANTIAKTTTTAEVSDPISPPNTSSVSNTSASSSSSGLRMKHQLLYLAQLIGFDVDFNDYPKGNHNEFLTIVTLTTTPAQICHGTGANSEESQNDASRNALKILSELGLNNVKTK